MDLEKFKEAWNDLCAEDQVELFIKFQQEYGDEELWYEFNEYNFNAMCGNKSHYDMIGEMQAAEIDWEHEYVHWERGVFIKTGDKYDVAKEAENWLPTIFTSYGYIWREYIDPDDYDEAGDEDSE